MGDSNQILSCHQGHVARLRVFGRAVAHQCPAVRRFAVSALEHGAREVRVELQECDYGDSTFMGTLLQIRSAAQKVSDDALSLVAPSPEFDEALRRMGLKRLFHVTSDTPADDATWQPLEAEACGTKSREFKENVVAAHRELAQSSETLAARYQIIADEAARELALVQPH